MVHCALPDYAPTGPHDGAPGAEPSPVFPAERNASMSTLDARFDLPPLAASVPTARHVVVELLRSWEVPHDLDDAALLVTELVSNVIDHVGGDATLTVELTSS